MSDSTSSVVELRPIDDIGMNASREKVRVAHALKALPLVSEAFASGALTCSKVRSLTRVAAPVNEEGLVRFALKATTQRVEERCCELRCGTELSTADADRAFARRALTAWPSRMAMAGPACRSSR